MAILSKSQVRLKIRSKRRNLNHEVIERSSLEVLEQIRDDLNYQAAKVIGIYLAIDNEINLISILNDKKRFAVPKIINNEIVFVEIDKASQLSKNKFNILEPIDTVIIEELDYLLVPSVAIYNNNRLGFGGGYYDRYLKHKRPKHVVGVIYSFQEVEFEVNDYDQQLDYYFKAFEV